MSLDALSGILSADFASSDRLARNIMVCLLLIIPAYIVWLKWTLDAKRHPRGRDPSAAELSKDEHNIISEPAAKFSGDGNHNASRATSSQDQSKAPTPKRKLPPTAYTVGWICAISTEHVAARALLDEEHEGPGDVPKNDYNNYTLGSVGEHDVVIAVLPAGEYGLAAAASVAKDLIRSFSNVRFGLMVGVGGGAPSQEHDIRLGDLVISEHGSGHGGVFQYDFGKTMQEKTFHATGYLDQPPLFLRTAVNDLKSEYKMYGHKFDQTINSILERNQRLREFRRPDPGTDRLYQSHVVHLDKEANCAMCCGNDPATLVSRRQRERHEDNPTIHYGLIASGNQVIKDATIRDKLIAEKDILCFEMEAAGLMSQFPCLVIRGICDYSDSHKNKEWQGYAAIVAAAYAKDLLCQVPKTRVKTKKSISDIFRGLQELQEVQLRVSQKQLELQKDAEKREWSDKQSQCHQLFRLTGSKEDTTYEWYKNRVEGRVEGTCQWFLSHENFHEWLNRDSGPLLVSADPGCGKSVLARYLIDEGLPQSSTICYFFFKEQDQNKICYALCALLHQLFSQKPPLIDYALSHFLQDGDKLINSTQSLWTILIDAVKDPLAGPVILILDALDECAEPDFKDLLRNLKNQFRSDHGKLKYLLTSRPYDTIISQFRDSKFQNIHIPGEEESDAISREVNYVITHRVGQLANQQRLPRKIKNCLKKKLQDIPHRTYLWVCLVFDYLEKESFKKTQKGIESTLSALPETVEEAYEQILGKSQNLMAWKALRIILAARRPLTLSEMNIAMSIEDTAESIYDVDLEDERHFQKRLRSSCGLMVSIYRGKVYFLHQTVREFLLAKPPATGPSKLCWRHSITDSQAHDVLADACVIYLNCYNFEASHLVCASWEPEPNNSRRESLSDDDLPTAVSADSGCTDSRAFLDYSAKAWGDHFREARIGDDNSIIPLTLRICNTSSRSYRVWSRIYWKTTRFYRVGNVTDLMLASHYGHCAIIKKLIESDADMEAKDSRCSFTPLLWAAEGKHESVVRLLLDRQANIEAKDNSGRTPLSWAADRGHASVVQLLLDRQANIEAGDDSGQTPLSSAAENGHIADVKLLLEYGAKIDAKNISCQTPLRLAVENEHQEVELLLLSKGAAELEDAVSFRA